MHLAGPLAALYSFPIASTVAYGFLLSGCLLLKVKLPKKKNKNKFEALNILFKRLKIYLKAPTTWHIFAKLAALIILFVSTSAAISIRETFQQNEQQVKRP